MIFSAGMVIVRQAEGKWLYLLLRAYNYWDFPKGEVEENENPFETAQREVREETGLNDLSYHWGRRYKETEPYRRKTKKARYYLAETNVAEVKFSVNPEIGGPEHHEYRWLEGQDLKKFVSERLFPIIDWARKLVESKS